MDENNILERKYKFVDFIHKDDVNRAIDNAVEKNSGGFVPPQEYRLVTPMGKVLWFIISSTISYENHNPVGLRSCLLDITEKKEYEKALQKSEEQLHTIFQAAPIGIVLFSEKKKITRINDAFSKLFSLPVNFVNSKIGFSVLLLNFHQLLPFRQYPFCKYRMGDKQFRP